MEKKIAKFFGFIFTLPGVRGLLYKQKSSILSKVTRNYWKFKQVYLKVFGNSKALSNEKGLILRLNKQFFLNFFNNNRKHMTSKLKMYKVIRNMNNQNLLDKVTLMTEKARCKIITIKKL